MPGFEKSVMAQAELAQQKLNPKQCNSLGLPPGTMWFDPSSKAQRDMINEQLKNSEYQVVRELASTETNSFRPGMSSQTSNPGKITSVPEEKQAVQWAKSKQFTEQEIDSIRNIFKLLRSTQPGWLTGIEFGKEIGKGAFGSIHKALYNGQEIAVKRVTQVLE